MKNTLIIMAAGKSSRYGSLKQTEIIGPSNVTLLEYNIYDALHSGFTDVILIIRKETQSYFEEIRKRIGNTININFVFQELTKYADNNKLSYQREKPWGTAHALLCCKGICNNPFVIINADDFYGRRSFEIASNFFKKETKLHLIIPYLLKNTLSENGTVNRGVCNIEKGLLINIVEKSFTKESAKESNTLVSMNFWGFQPTIFNHIEALFKHFLEIHQNPNDEFFIGEVAQHIIDKNLASITTIQSKERCYGITYKTDKEQTHISLCQLDYPKNLWTV